MLLKWPWTKTQIIQARPDMTRRRFLKAMAAVPIAAALAPELVDMLRPPKTYSVPKLGDYLTSPHAWLNDVFSREYRSADWRGVFGNPPDDGVALISAAHPNWNYSNELGTQVDLTPESIDAINKQLWDTELYGFGMARMKHEGGAIRYDHIPANEYVQRYTHQTYALGFKITQETDEDLTDYDALSGRYRDALVASINETVRTSRDYHAARVYNEAFQDQSRGADHSSNALPMPRLISPQQYQSIVPVPFKKVAESSEQLSRDLVRAADRLSAIPEALNQTVTDITKVMDELPREVESLAHGIARSPIDLVRRLLGR